MSMAGYPLNKGAEYYKKAAEMAKQVIDGSKEDGNGTYDITMDADWKNVYSMGNNYNTETIVGINFSPIIDWSTDSQLSSCNTFESLGTGGWGDGWGEIKFWMNFPEGPRKAATYDPQIRKKESKDGKDVYNLYYWYEKITDSQGNKTAAIAEEHPMFSIFSVNATDEAGLTPIDAPYDYRLPNYKNMCNGHRHRLIRYPEVLLWYAESAARAGMDLTDAKKYLKKVRARAVNADEADKVNGVAIDAMNADQLAEAAYAEHGWEVAGYWVAMVPRRSDEFRMNRLKDNFEYRVANAPVTVNGDQFVEKVKVSGTWTEDKVYIPYPATEVEKNPNLKR